MSMALETGIYRIPVSHYMHGAVGRLLSRWWWLVALPLVALLIAGMLDWRWWIVALAVVCVVLPGVVLLAFYYYALSPEAVRCIMPQRARLEADRLTIQYFPMEKKEGQESSDWAPEPMVIYPSEVQDCMQMGEYTVIRLKNGREVEIPCHAQPKDMNLSSFFSQNHG